MDLFLARRTGQKDEKKGRPSEDKRGLKRIENNLEKERNVFLF